MHRWVWDLHYPAPDATRHEYPIAAIPGDTPRYPLGPTVLPGTYTARLTANGKSYTASFTVKMDPRMKISAADLDKKFELEMRLASLLSRDFARPQSKLDRFASRCKSSASRPRAQPAIPRKLSRTNSLWFLQARQVSLRPRPTQLLFHE